MLVQKGKLVEVGPDGECCTTCGLQPECNLLAPRGKRYTVASFPSKPTGRWLLGSVGSAGIEPRGDDKIENPGTRLLPLQSQQD